MPHTVADPDCHAQDIKMRGCTRKKYRKMASSQEGGWVGGRRKEEERDWRTGKTGNGERTNDFRFTLPKKDK